MNRRAIVKQMSLAVLALGAATVLPNCTTTSGIGGGESLPPATKDNPFVNSLGMKFVSIPGTKILMCTTETTLSQYKAMGRTLLAPGFPQSGNHPTVGVSWDDAKAWCVWLSTKEGRRYRLPTDSEWSAAVGDNQYPWGNSWPPPNNVGNFAGQEMRSLTSAEREKYKNMSKLTGGFPVIQGFRDQHKFTAPVGSYPASFLGIYDLGGNAWEWCEDLHPDPSFRGERQRRVMRGGGAISFSHQGNYESSYRLPGIPFHGGETYGFRCVVE